MVDYFSMSKTKELNHGSTLDAYTLDALAKAFPNLAGDGKRSDLSLIEAYREVAPVRASVDLPSRICQMAKVRLFTDQGDEIVGGALFNLIQRTPFLVQNIVSNYRLFNEIAVEKQNTSIRSGPTKLKVLDPSQLNDNAPEHVEVDRDSIMAWQYINRQIKDENLIFAKGPGPGDTLRGRNDSIFQALKFEINLLYQINRFSLNILKNDATPKKIVSNEESFPKNFNEQMSSTHSALHGRSGLISYLSNIKNLQVHDVGAALADVPVRDLTEFLTETILATGGISAVVSNLVSRTRFDSAEEEIKVFFTNTINPILDLVSQVLQEQLVNSHRWDLDIEIEQCNKSKSLKHQINSQFNLANSNIVIVVDKDTLPYTSELKKPLFELGKVLISDYHQTIRQVNDYLGLELQENEWFDKSFTITSKVLTETPAPEIKEEKPEEDKEEKPEDVEDSADTKELISKTSKYFNELRKYCLRVKHLNKVPRLADFDELNENIIRDEKVKKFSRIIFSKIIKCKSEDEIKRIFNNISKKEIRNLIKV